MKSKNARAEIDAWFDARSAQMIDDLRALIAVKSVRGAPKEGMPYGEGPARALTMASELLMSRGFDVRDFEHRVLTADLGSGAPELGILAHVDVVPEGDGWDSDPFRAEIRDGKIYGRGASDDKGPAVAAIYAMTAAREIAPDLKKTFRLILGSAEETGCADIAFYLNIEKPPRYVFSPDADFPVINTEKGRFVPIFGADWPEDKTLPRVISLKGGETPNIVPNKAEAVVEGIGLSEVSAYCSTYSRTTGVRLTAEQAQDSVMISARGVSAHASCPQKGANAQTALLSMFAAMPFAESRGQRAICALTRLFPHGDTAGRALGIDMSDELSGALTLNFGVLDFGPTGFEGNFDSRTPACATKKNMRDVAVSVIEREGIRIESFFSDTACHHTPPDSPFVRRLLNIYEDYTGLEGMCLAVGGSTYVHEIEGGVAFGCAMPGIDYRIHGANEFIGVDELVLSAKMFTQAILDICS